MKKGKSGFTKFNENQIKAMKKGEDISNVEFINIAESLSTDDHPSEVDTFGGGDTNPLDEVSSTAATDEVGLSSSSAAIVPASSGPSSSSDDPSTFPVHCFCWRDKKHV